MKFRSAIGLASFVIITGVVGITSMAGARVMEHDSRAAVDAELTRGALVFEGLFAHRQSLFAANAKVIAEEPRLKAVVATEDIDHATILDVSSELRRTVGSDLFLITDGQGMLLADVADPSASGFALRDKPLVADALADGQGQGIWTTEGRAYQMASQRLAFGERIVGVLAVGWEIDDELTTAAAQQTGGAVVVLAGEHAIASSLPPGTMRGALPSDAELDGMHVTVAVDDSPHRAITGRLGGDPPLRYLVLRSLDEALATSRRLVRQIYGIGGGALLVAILLSLWFAQRLSQPLRALVDFTGEIAAGHLERRLSPHGPREIEQLGDAMNRMAMELATSREQLAAKERLEREMEIANRIQTSVLPVDLSIAGYSIAASMETASEVGGDYYDVIPTSTGGFVGIGDVAGHGLPAGVVMLMVQSATSVLVQSNPDATPSALIAQINTFLYDNIRTRLAQDEHVTFTLLRCSSDGELVFAGAHEEIVVWRAATGTCSRLPTPGPWLGVLRDVRHATRDQVHRLDPGDLMLLYTDGLTEAMNESGEQFGMDRLCALVEANAQRPVDEIVEQARQRVEAWSRQRADDVTIVAVRYAGPPPAATA